MMEPVRVALSLIGILIIIVGAYYATYYIGLKASGQNRGMSRGRTRNINLLERFAISKDKSFCIVEIAGRIYVVGITNQTMTLLDTLKAEEITDFSVERNNLAARSVTPGGLYRGKIVTKVAAFIAQKMGRTPESSDDQGSKSETFADSMKIAREKNISGQPDHEKADMPDSSEVEK